MRSTTFIALSVRLLAAGGNPTMLRLKDSKPLNKFMNTQVAVFLRLTPTHHTPATPALLRHTDPAWP